MSEASLQECLSCSFGDDPGNSGDICPVCMSFVCIGCGERRASAELSEWSSPVEGIYPECRSCFARENRR